MNSAWIALDLQITNAVHHSHPPQRQQTNQVHFVLQMHFSMKERIHVWRDVLEDLS